MAVEKSEVAADCLCVIVHYGDVASTVKVTGKLVREGHRCVVVANDQVERPHECPSGVDWLLPERNLGYAGAFNFAVRKFDADVYALLNPDLEIPVGTLRRCLSTLDDSPEIGIIGPLVRHPDGRIQSGAGDVSPRLRSTRVRREPTLGVNICTWVTGAFMVIRGSLAKELPMSEGYFLGAEDVDFCLEAAKRGWRTAVIGSEYVTHRGGESIGAWWYYYAPRNRVWLARRQSSGYWWLLAWFRQGLKLPRVIAADVLRRHETARSRWFALGLGHAFKRVPPATSFWNREPVPLRPKGARYCACSPVKVAVPYGWFEPGTRHGGVVRSLVNEMASAGDCMALHVITRDRDLGTATPYEGLTGVTRQRGRHRITYLNGASPLLGLQVLRELLQEKSDVLYVNGLWSPQFGLVPLLMRRLRIIRPRAVLLAPRGMLSPGALSLKKLRKRMILAGLQWVIERDVTWQASSAAERADIVAVFPQATVRICADPVNHLPERASQDFAVHEVPRLVFISRISPMKNLLGALQAMRDIPRPFEFDIYGPVEDASYWRSCQQAAAEVDVGRVAYRGELKPSETVDVFSRYDLFVFPTFGENFGHVVAESLAGACPVLVSRHTPWTETVSQGAGFVVADDLSEMRDTLTAFIAWNGKERADLKERAAALYDEWRERVQDDSVLRSVVAGLGPHRGRA